MFAVFGRSLFINPKDYHFRGKTTIHPLGDVSDFFGELELHKFIFAKQIWQPQVANCDCRAWRHLKAIKARGARYLRCVCLGGVPSSRFHVFFLDSFYQIAPGPVFHLLPQESMQRRASQQKYLRRFITIIICQPSQSPVRLLYTALNRSRC